jgi:hypothetical protein
MNLGTLMRRVERLERKAGTSVGSDVPVVIVVRGGEPTRAVAVLKPAEGYDLPKTASVDAKAGETADELAARLRRVIREGVRRG